MAKTNALTTTRTPVAANAMAPNATAVQLLLSKIGRDLDREVFPQVWNGGLVLPSGHPLPLQSLGAEHFDDQPISKFQTGSEPATWARAPGGEQAGTSSAPGDWPSGTAAPFPRADVDLKLSKQFEELAQAYPGTRIWSQDRGSWLCVPATILPGLGRSACFVLQIQLDIQSLECARAWGFWCAGRVGATWIGPRHTNYLDGSICAFEQDAGTWRFGDSLVALLDILSLWATRQLYLENFGSWPGPQASSYPYERLLEFQDTEHCGCMKPEGRYSQCCKPRDASIKLLAIACTHIVLCGWRTRQAPAAIMDLVLHGKPPFGME